MTRDACAEILRALLGRPRRIPLETLRQLHNSWSSVRTPVEAQRTSLSAALIHHFGAPLSERTEGNLRTFLELLVMSCPALYSEHALRRRCRFAGTLAMIALGSVALLSRYNAIGNRAIGIVCPTLLLAGALGLKTAIELWRTRRAIVRLVQHEAPSELVASSLPSLSRSLDEQQSQEIRRLR